MLTDQTDADRVAMTTSASTTDKSAASKPTSTAAEIAKDPDVNDFKKLLRDCHAIAAFKRLRTSNKEG